MKIIKALLASREMGLLILLVALCVGFGLASESFRDPYNFLDRSRHWVEVGILAVPMTFIIATGGIDLSVGSLLALCGIVSGLCFKAGVPLPLALTAGVLTGVAGGAINGAVTAWLRVPALVVTLATMALYRGMAMGLSHADPIRNFPTGFTSWGSMATVGWGDWQVPWQTLIMLGLVAMGAFVFGKTCLGRWSVQIGENPRAARFSAVPVHGVLFWIYAASGLMCGLAAISYTARFATAHPAAATGLELEVIACVVIGGTRITGGNGSVLGTFLGVLILGVIKFGMDMLAVPQQYQIILIGMLVVLAAIVNEWIARRREQRIRPAAKAKILNGGIQ